MANTPEKIFVFSSLQGSGVEIESISLDAVVEKICGFRSLFGVWPIMQISGMNPLSDIEQMLYRASLDYDRENGQFFLEGDLLPHDSVFAVVLREPHP